MFKKRTTWSIAGAALTLLLALSILVLSRAQPSIFPVYIPFIAQTFITATVNLAVSTIDIVDYEFQPSYGGQAAGVMITWVNKGTTAHTVTFDNGAGASGPIQMFVPRNREWCIRQV